MIGIHVCPHADNTARPGQDSCGRPIWRRSTATSWRSTSNSATIADSLRVTCRSQPNTGTALKYSNRTNTAAILRLGRETVVLDDYDRSHRCSPAFQVLRVPSPIFAEPAVDAAALGHPVHAGNAPSDGLAETLAQLLLALCWSCAGPVSIAAGRRAACDKGDRQGVVRRSRSCSWRVPRWSVHRRTPAWVRAPLAWVTSALNVSPGPMTSGLSGRTRAAG
jgi:hypothetical protein